MSIIFSLKLSNKKFFAIMDILISSDLVKEGFLFDFR